MVTSIKGNDTSTFGGNVDVPQIITDAPAFSLIKTSNQTVTTGILTKATFDSAEFDTTSDVDLTNNKVVPSVEGYYLISLNVRLSGITDGGQTITFIYKNGSEFKRGSQFNNGATSGIEANSSHLIYFNGSTDYLEAYVYHNTGSDKTIPAGSTYTTLSGYLARAV